MKAGRPRRETAGSGDDAVGHNPEDGVLPGVGRRGVTRDQLGGAVPAEAIKRPVRLQRTTRSPMQLANAAAPAAAVAHTGPLAAEIDGMDTDVVHELVSPEAPATCFPLDGVTPALAWASETLNVGRSQVKHSTAPNRRPTRLQPRCDVRRPLGCRAPCPPLGAGRLQATSWAGPERPRPRRWTAGPGAESTPSLATSAWAHSGQRRRRERRRPAARRSGRVGLPTMPRQPQRWHTPCRVLRRRS